ncbi:ATP-binding protein [Amycolatopsis sp. cmx-4-83]|uniref:ATP-binding protein n=1 Tax=Amycolatopsis sp. cmx-4-83 TaxID=2790940 RepID=UPI00397C8F29
MTIAVPDPSPKPQPGVDERAVTAMEDLQCLAVPAVAGQLVLLREHLDAWTERAGLDQQARQTLLLAAYEAMANVVVHAYRGADGVLDLHACDRGDVVVVTVADHGRWQPAARPGPLHGRGLPLIRALSAEAVVEKNAAGTTVTMTFIRQPG